jgi:predicted translin family RNA/ssDNA-binding protein
MKRAKRESSTAAIQEELNGISRRMEHREYLRETLVKKARDGQKAAKQAIYALHRDDPEEARRLLIQCKACITHELLPITQEEPPLRWGTCSNVIEEFAEAWLFYVWLLGKEGEGSSKDCVVPSSVLLKPEDFSIALQPEEYLGALCDLTGEIGRYAVHKVTARDGPSVKGCLETNAAIMVGIRTMEKWPSSTGQKINQLRRSVEKIERMTYEMSLSEATGRTVATAVVPLELIIPGLVKLVEPEIEPEITDLILPAPSMPGFPAAS